MIDNILLGDQTCRQLLRKLEALSQGSPFEQEAIATYIEKALRRRLPGVIPFDPSFETEILETCKAELSKSFPSASDKELDELAKARVTQIKELSDQLINRDFDIRASLFAQLEAHLEGQMYALLKEIDEINVDEIIDRKLAELPDSTQKLILTDMFGEKIAGEVIAEKNRPVHMSGLKRAIEGIMREKKRTLGVV